MPACPVCHAPHCPLFCTKRTTPPGSSQAFDWPIHRCPVCRHGFVFPRPSLEDVTRYNAEASFESPLPPPTLEAVRARRDVTDFTRAVARYAKLKGRSLDVGSGDGSFSVGVAQVGFTPHMIDLDPRGAGATAVVSGASFAVETFEGLRDRGPYALIVMSQVLEHALDPMDWLRRAHDLLLPGGMLAIALPNFGGIYRLLGARDPYLIPPVHVNFFTPASMRHALTTAGLTPTRIDSDSHMTPRRWDGKIGAKRLALSLTMKLAAPLLDPFARGIILRAFAHRDG